MMKSLQAEKNLPVSRGDEGRGAEKTCGAYAEGGRPMRKKCRAFVFDNCLAFGYGNLSVYGSGTPAESEKQQIPQNDSCDCLRIFRRYGDLSGRLGKYCSHVCIFLLQLL